MSWKSWDELPESMKTDGVRPYFDIIASKRISLCFKRIFDIIAAVILIIILFIPIAVIWICIKADSRGPVFFRQVRVTAYCKEFRIFKFRTMVVNAENLGTQVTTAKDPRITKVGHKLRRLRLDELPQLFNIITGDMSFVGTRPEVPRYVDKYTDEMMATLLLPAGVTSLASITFKDEDKMMDGALYPDIAYVEDVLPIKMQYNLKSLKEFGFWKDFAMLFRTVKAVLH